MKVTGKHLLSFRPFWRLLATLSFAFTLNTTAAFATEYTLAVQPILSPEQTHRAFAPLAQYLSKVTGHNVKLVASENFVTYWVNMRKVRYDLVLDAAHFTDYRIQKMDYTPLVRLPSDVSFSVVTRADSLVLDVGELIGKPVTTMGSPGLGAIRLYDMFPNPLRQPVMLWVDNTEAAVEKLQTGEAEAAIIPSRMLGTYPDLNVIRYTEPAPAPALSAAPTVDEQTREKIVKALTAANTNETGQALLQALNFAGFVAADKETYKGYASLLSSVWGY